MTVDPHDHWNDIGEYEDRKRKERPAVPLYISGKKGRDYRWPPGWWIVPFASVGAAICLGTIVVLLF